MKIPRHNLYRFSNITAFCCILIAAALLFSGCRIFGFLASEGPFETKKPAQYDLKAQQDRKILLWIETPRSLNVSNEAQDKLRSAFTTYIIKEMKIKASNLVTPPASTNSGLSDPMDVAKSLGAGFVLLVQVDVFELDSLKMKDYFTGQIITRTILLDADSAMAVWPKQPEGKMTHVGVEVETGGRDAAISRLVSASAHCSMRYLYPCDKLKYKHPDERVSAQETFEIETY